MDRYPVQLDPTERQKPLQLNCQTIQLDSKPEYLDLTDCAFKVFNIQYTD